MNEAANPGDDRLALNEAAFGRLPPQKLKALRLAGRPATAKEIAREMNISPKTVSGYLDEAVAILGAENRRHAAALLRDFEARTNAPAKSPGANSRVETRAISTPSQVARERTIDWRSLLPIRQKGSAHNVLHPLARPIWIFVLTVAGAGAFSLFAHALALLSDLWPF